MIKLTQSLRHWLWENHPELITPLLFGHIEVFTEDINNAYMEWCKTEDGRQYLKGGSKYKEEFGEFLGRQI